MIFNSMFIILFQNSGKWAFLSLEKHHENLLTLLNNVNLIFEAFKSVVQKHFY